MAPRVKATTRETRMMIIETPGQAIDALGGNAAVARWLSIEIGRPAEQNTISGWRKRGISRNFAVHFFAELVERRGHKLMPGVFGLDSWDMVLMPDKRGQRVRKLA
jgi:hypothetical protein